MWPFGRRRQALAEQAHSTQVSKNHIPLGGGGGGGGLISTVGCALIEHSVRKLRRLSLRRLSTST